MPTLRAERERLGFTQAQVAALCGVHDSSVSLWESGRRFPRQRQAGRLVAIFGRPVAELLPNENGAAPKDGPADNLTTPATTTKQGSK